MDAINSATGTVQQPHVNGDSQNRGISPHSFLQLTGIPELSGDDPEGYLRQIEDTYVRTDGRGNVSVSIAFSRPQKGALLAWLRSIEADLVLDGPTKANNTRDWMSNLNSQGKTGNETVDYFIDPDKPIAYYRLPRPLVVTFPKLSLKGSLMIERSGNDKFELTLRVGYNFAHNTGILPRQMAAVLGGFSPEAEPFNIPKASQLVEKLQKERAARELIRNVIASGGKPPASIRRSEEEIIRGLIQTYEAFDPIAVLMRQRRNSTEPPMTLSQAAAESGIDPRAYAKLELPNPANDTALGRETLKKLSVYLNLDLNVICYKMNRALYPRVSPDWYVFSHRIVLMDSSTGQFLTELDARMEGRPADATRVRIVKAILKKHGHVLSTSSYGGVGGIWLRSFLLAEEPEFPLQLPTPANLKKLSEETAVPLEELEAYVIDLLIPPSFRRKLDDLEQEPAMGAWLKTKGITKINFSVQCRSALPDNGKIAYYIQEGTERSPAALGKAGLKFFILRKLSGLTVKELEDGVNISHHILSKLETDEAGDHIKDRLISKLSHFYGIPEEAMRRWLLNTYGGVTHYPNEGDPTDDPVKQVFRKAAAGFKDASAMASRINTTVAPVMPGYAITQDYVRDIGHALSSGITIESRHWGAFNLTFGDLSGLDRMWALAFEKLSVIFPTLAGEKPHIVLSDKLNLDNLGTVSLPLGLLRRRLGDPENLCAKKDLIPGVSASYISVLEAMDIVPQEPHKYVAYGKALRISPQALYLTSHPWILLGVPVLTPTGEPHPGFQTTAGLTHDQIIELGKKMELGLARLSDGRHTLQAALDKLKPNEPSNPTTRQKTLESLGYTAAEAKRALGEQTMPRDEELIRLAELKPLAIDRLALLEGYRKGELLFFMGQNPDGSVDYSYPPGWDESRLESLDLLEAAHTIATRNGASFKGFWDAQTRFNADGPGAFRRFLEKGFSQEQTVRMAHLAKKARLPGITRKVIYLKQQRHFISRFTPLGQAHEADRPGLGAFMPGNSLVSGASMLARPAG